jgi:hypothetical protein
MFYVNHFYNIPCLWANIINTYTVKITSNQDSSGYIFWFCYFHQGSLTEEEGSVRLTSFYQHLFILKILFAFVTNNTIHINEEFNCANPSLQLVFPALTKYLELLIISTLVVNIKS